jgi:hypothetical protein
MTPLWWQLIKDFCSDKFTMSTFRSMRDLQQSVGQDSDDYIDAHNELKTRLTLLHKRLVTSVFFLKHQSPEHLAANWNINDLIVEPWNSVVSAKMTNHHVLLEEHHRFEQEQAEKDGYTPPVLFDLPAANESLKDDLYQNLKASLPFPRPPAASS